MQIKFFKYFIHNLLTSGVYHSLLSERLRKILLINIICIVSIAYMSILIFKTHEVSITKNQTLSIILAAISLGVMFYLRITQKEKTAGHLLSLTLYLIIVYMLHFIHENTFVYIWIFIFAIISFILTNKMIGIIYNSLLALSILAEFYFINNTNPNFQEEYKTRYILVWGSIVFISYLHEYLREKNITINRSINKERVKYIAALIKEKQNNQLQMQKLRNELEELNFYKIIIENQHAASVITNSDKQILWYNHAFQSKFKTQLLNNNDYEVTITLEELQNRIPKEIMWNKKALFSTTKEQYFLYTLKNQ